MKTRSLFSSALPLAVLSVLLCCSLSSSQVPRVPGSRVLIDGFQWGQPPGGILIDDTADSTDIPVFLPVESLQPVRLLPDGLEVRNPVIGTLIFDDEESRAVTPAFQFDTARPLVVEYMELHGRLAERLNDEQLEAEIAELREMLEVMDADDDLDDIRQSLQNLIESHPDTPAAEAAREALEQLEAADQSSENDNPFFNGGDLKPASGNRRFD